MDAAIPLRQRQKPEPKESKTTMKNTLNANVATLPASVNWIRDTRDSATFTRNPNVDKGPSARELRAAKDKFV